MRVGGSSTTRRLPTRSGRRPTAGVRGRVATAITVLGLAAGLAAGATPVRAAGLSVDLDQWASLNAAWQNGDLNGNNARYPEGGVIPFRLAIEGLAAGAHTITISYDFTASGHKAYDFLATWSATNRPGLCLPSGGAISSMCPGLPAPSTFAFPSDTFRANGLQVRDAEAWSGASRLLTIFGGTVDAISGPFHAGSPDGNSTAEVHVRFRSTGSAVLFAWGGHLAQSSFWDTSAGGARDGASMVSGAPWHMRTLNLDGGGARNQDRSIQPSAVVGELPPFALSPTPRPTTPPPTVSAPGGPASGGSGSGPGPGGASVPTVPPTASVDRDGARGSGVGDLVPMSVLAAIGLVAAWAAGERRGHRPPRR